MGFPAAQPGLAYRQPPEGFIPDEVFCFKYYRTVGLDNVVRFGEHRLQIMPTNGRLSYARARGEIHERLVPTSGLAVSGYQVSTVRGSRTQGEEYSPGYTRYG